MNSCLIAAVLLAATTTKPSVHIPVPSTPEAFIVLQRNAEKLDAEIAELTARREAIKVALEKAAGMKDAPVRGRPLMNGFEVKEFDATAAVCPVELNKSFNPKRPWYFSAEYQADAPPNGFMVFWGDSRGGSDPMQIRVRGGKFEVGLTDCVGRKKQEFAAPVGEHEADKWVRIDFVFDTIGRMGYLKVGGKVVAKDALIAAPVQDVPMPIILGGMSEGRDRFKAKLRNVLLTNYEPTR